MKKSRLQGAVCALLFFSNVHVDLITIDFDTPLADYVPEFRTTRNVTDQFQSLGILFSSAFIQDEGGPNCAVHQTTQYCRDDLMLWGVSTITFVNEIDFFSIFAFYSGGPTWVNAFDADGNLLRQIYATRPATETISFYGLDNIYRVELHTRATAIAWDDVVFNAVPIPAAAWLFVSGLLGLIGMARRKSS